MNEQTKTMNPSIETFGRHSKLSKLATNDSDQLKKSGITSPNLSKLKAIKINDKTTIYR